MDDLNENHLLRLHSYLQRNLHFVPGINIMKTELMSHCNTEFLKSKVNKTDMCPHCFCHWSEGIFSSKFKSKKSKRKKCKQMIWRIKCLNCEKSVKVVQYEPLTKTCKLKIEKPKTKFIKQVKRQPSKEKQKPKGNTSTKKSNLTFLKDFCDN